LATPGPVVIATTGNWAGTTFGLQGGLGSNFNHAKIGVSTAADTHYAILGDMNQQGALSGKSKDCGKSPNGRGGLFYVLDDQRLHDGLAELIKGGTARTTPDPTKCKKKTTTAATP